MFKGSTCTLKVSVRWKNENEKNKESTFEFSLNDFPWIQRIQWIMTKSKSSRYLLNRYQPIVSSGKLLFTTILRNVSIARCRMSLVTRLLLDLVMIYWIQRKSFRENSIASPAAQIVVNCSRRIAALIAHYCLSATINHSPCKNYILLNGPK